MAYTSIPLWYFRTDSNIVADEKADELRNIYQIFQDWKEQTDNNNKNRLTIIVEIKISYTLNHTTKNTQKKNFFLN